MPRPDPAHGSAKASPKLAAELDRVGASMGTAGASEGVIVVGSGNELRILGSPSYPGKVWAGTEERALELLASLEDGAGVAAFWAAFTRRHRWLTRWG